MDRGGAEYQLHWSLIPPARPVPPRVKTESWIRNPIDRFILAKLEEQGLQPAPEADRRTLARRLSLDLTGLPPCPGRRRGVRERYVCRCLREARRPLAGITPLGRAPGTVLAGRRAAMPTPTATTSTTSARCGPTAIGSSARSIATCPSTASPSSSSPATCCPTARSTSRSPRASTAAT